MTFSNSVLLWSVWDSRFESDSNFLCVVTEGPFNKFGGIITSNSLYFCVMNIFRMFLKDFEEFECFVTGMESKRYGESREVIDEKKIIERISDSIREFTANVHMYPFEDARSACISDWRKRVARDISL